MSDTIDEIRRSPARPLIEACRRSLFQVLSVRAAARCDMADRVGRAR